MNKYAFLILSFAFFALVACQPKDEIITLDSSAKLSFSKDTILFDTVFTTFRTTTKRLTIYNKNTRAINISNITLANNSNSPFKIIINGTPTSQQKNLTLRANDSILILIEAKINTLNQNAPLLLRDSITFNTNNNLQHVKILAFGQDANLITKPTTITQNTTWTNDKPYVLLDSLIVSPTATLTIQQGTQIYAANKGTLIIAGALHTNGTTAKPIILQGFRTDETFKNTAGQWTGVIFTQSSKNNHLTNTRIRNAIIGIFTGAPPDTDTIPDLTLQNVLIENMRYGLIATSYDISLSNTVIRNCANQSLLIRAGGSYTFNHCTFVNYRFNFTRNTPSYTFNNYFEAANLIFKDDLNITAQNTFFWGDLENELDITLNNQAKHKLLFQNNFIRISNNKLTEYQLNTTYGSKNIINADSRYPKFKNPFNADLTLDSLSPAINYGITTPNTIDFTGKLRDTKPDIGAYERLK
jgi:hypothetical protein